MMRRANILILFANDNPQHVQVVQAFSNFLRVEENKFSVSLSCWEELQTVVKDWRTWFCKKLDWADKVVLVASQNFFQYQDESFEQAVQHLSKTTTGKFQIVYFENTDITYHIPPLLKLLPKYQLMKQMEKLFFKLHNIEQYEPGKAKEAPWLSEDAYTESPEGRTLYTAIQYLKNKHSDTRNNDDHYDTINNDDSGYLSQHFNSLMPSISQNMIWEHNIKEPNMINLHQNSSFAQLPHNKTENQLFNVPSSLQSVGFSEQFEDVMGKHHEDSDTDSVYSSVSARGLYSGKLLGNGYAPTETEV